MPTTVTIEQDTLDQLSDLKQMLREMGSTQYFKTDIVRDVIDDLHDDVRTAYYAEKAEPFLRARRYNRHEALLNLWTRERIIDELFHEGYREDYREAYGAEGDDRYVNDVRDTLIDYSEWFRTRPLARVSEAVVAERTPSGAPRAYAAMYRDDGFYVSHRGIGNACEIAQRRVQNMARDALSEAGVETSNAWCGPHLLPAEYVDKT